MKISVNFELIMVEDPKIGGFSGHLVQFPNIIAEGQTEKELIENLFNMIHDVMSYEYSLSEPPKQTNGVIRKSLNLNTSLEETY